MTKVCPRCKQEKPLASFLFNTGTRSYRCKECRAALQKEANIKYRAKNNLRARKRRMWLKTQVLSHYSDEAPKCTHCGETDVRVLTIDHIDGGGNAHRRIIGRDGSSFYQWLLQNNYPEGFQVLCWNCNIRKRWEQLEYGVNQ